MHEELHREYFNLEGGDRCFFFEDRFIIDHRLKVKKDNFKLDHSPGKNIRKRRMILNIVLTSLFFVFVFYTGFYPLIIASFLSIWDLNQIKRYTYPVTLTNCFAIKNIQEVKIRKGGLSFNYIDIILKTDDGNLSMRPLKIYDSDEETTVALKLFQSLGFIDHKALEMIDGEKIIGEFIELSPRRQAYFNDKGVYFTVDHKFMNKTTDFVYLKDKIFIFTSLFFLFLVATKLYWMMSGGISNLASFILISFLLLGVLVPLKFIRISNTSFIPKENITKTKTLSKNKGFIIYFKDDSNKSLKRRVIPYENYLSYEKLSSLMKNLSSI